MSAARAAHRPGPAVVVARLPPSSQEYCLFMETVEVNGLRLAYRRTGHGAPVVFVHGGVEDSRPAPSSE